MVHRTVHMCPIVSFCVLPCLWMDWIASLQSLLLESFHVFPLLLPYLSASSFCLPVNNNSVRPDNSCHFGVHLCLCNLCIFMQAMEQSVGVLWLLETLGSCCNWFSKILEAGTLGPCYSSCISSCDGAYPTHGGALPQIGCYHPSTYPAGGRTNLYHPILTFVRMQYM